LEQYALEHPEEIEEKKRREQELLESSVIQPTSESIHPPPPWDDGGDEVVVNKIVAPGVNGRPFEIYYYEPFAGYGEMQFFEDGIGFLFPKRRGSGSSQGGGDIGGGRELWPYIIFGFLWLISWLTSRPKNEPWLGKKLTNVIPYKEINEIQLDGRTLEFHMIEEPGLLNVRVGLCDGERLYRELFHHYPFVVSKRKEQLQQKILFEEIVISIDGGELNKATDGKIIMGSDPTIMTWPGIIFGGVLALALLALGISSYIDGGSGVSVFLPLILFGYLAYYAYQKSQRGQVIIDPTSHKIKSRNREIHFDDIESIVAIYKTHGLFVGIKVTFQARVTNGNPMILGSISGDRAKTKKKRKQIMKLLSDTGLSVKF